MLNSPRHPLVPTAYTAAKPLSRDAVNNEIASLVQHYLTNLHRYDATFERREHTRYAFPAVMSLTPVEPIQLEPLDEPLLVVGKQISVSGLGFFHTRALTHRCFLVSVQGESVGNAVCESQLVLRTKWCRFLGKGLYESGGQFIRIVPNGLSDEP